jgi:hypothetical protein
VTRRPVTLLAVLAAVALLVAACGDGGGGASVATGGTSSVAARSSAASTSIAHCGTGDAIGRFTCYQQALVATLDTKGAAAALARLARLDQTDRFVQSQCHQLAHQLGHAGFAYYHSVTKATAQGSEICWSGYYHGVVEAYISRWTNAKLKTQMPRICKQTPGHPYSLAYYNCWHGLGHGLTIRFGNDVFKALPYCDAIGKSWEQQSCYSGVFMQNIVVDGVMHHSVDLKRSDPVYPCDAVAERQKSSCYLMVTSYVLKVKSYDYAATFKVCDRVEKAFIATCYQSLGRDISGNSLLDPAKVHELCALGTASHRSWCVVGAAKNAVYERHEPSQADALCRLYSGALRKTCTQARNEAVATL